MADAALLRRARARRFRAVALLMRRSKSSGPLDGGGKMSATVANAWTNPESGEAFTNPETGETWVNAEQ